MRIWFAHTFTRSGWPRPGSHSENHWSICSRWRETVRDWSYCQGWRGASGRRGHDEEQRFVPGRCWRRSGPSSTRRDGTRMAGWTKCLATRRSVLTGLVIAGATFTAPRSMITISRAGSFVMLHAPPKTSGRPDRRALLQRRSSSCWSISAMSRSQIFTVTDTLPARVSCLVTVSRACRSRPSFRRGVATRNGTSTSQDRVFWQFLNLDRARSSITKVRNMSSTRSFCRSAKMKPAACGSSSARPAATCTRSRRPMAKISASDAARHWARRSVHSFECRMFRRSGAIGSPPTRRNGSDMVTRSSPAFVLPEVRPRLRPLRCWQPAHCSRSSRMASQQRSGGSTRAGTSESSAKDSALSLTSSAASGKRRRTIRMSSTVIRSMIRSRRGPAVSSPMSMTGATA